MSNELIVRDQQPELAIVPGMTLRRALEISVSAELLGNPCLVVFNHGTEIIDVDNYYVMEGDRILVGLLPQGGGGDRGKGIGQIIAGIALIVVGAFTAIAGDYSGSVIQLGAGMLLSGAASMLVKAPSLNTNHNQDLVQSRDSAYYGITGQSNATKAYGPVPKLYGTYKVFPNIAATPIINNVGTESRISAIYDFGVGWVQVKDIRIGDTPVGQFDPETRVHTNVKDIQPQLATAKVAYDQYSYVLQVGAPLTLRTSRDSWRAEIDLAFTQGLVQFNQKGVPVATPVHFQAYYRKVGSTSWIALGPENVSGMPAYPRSEVVGSARKMFVDPDGWVTRVLAWYTLNPEWPAGEVERDSYLWRGTDMGTSAVGVPLTVKDGTYGYKAPVLSRGAASGNGTYKLNVTATMPVYSALPGFYINDVTTKPKVASLAIQFDVAGEYEIQITRLTPISTDTKLYNSATVTMLKSYVTGPMFNLEQPHTMIELRLLASQKISGVVQNLSAYCTSVLPRYNSTGGLVGNYATRNNAWIALDMMIGSATLRPVPHSQIDWPSWVELADYCDQQRTWNVNGVVVTGPRHTLDVVIDYKTTVKEAVDSALSSCRAALIVTQTGKYGVLIDQQKTIPRQIITPSNSWDFSGNITFSPEVHAFKVGFVDEQRDYQRQEITVYRDGYSASNATKFEDLGSFGITDYYHAWSYGRYMMAQAVLRAEVFTLKMDIEHLAVQRGDLVCVQHDVPKIGGFSTRISSKSGNVIEVAQALGTAPTHYSVRTSAGVVRQGVVINAIDQYHFTIDNASDLGPDDVIVLGLSTAVTAPYLIQTIEPQADMAAQLTLVVYNAQLYDADIGAMPPWDPQFGDDILNATSLAVTSVTVTPSIIYVDRKPIEVMGINFTVNSPFYAYADVYLEYTNERPELIDQTTTLYAQDEFSLIASTQMHQATLTYTVTPYTTSGLQGTSMSGTATVLQDPPPSAPPRFDLDLKRDTISFVWEAPADEDISHYELRYDPATENSSMSHTTIVTPSIPWPSTTVEVPARLGTYYMRTFDTTGKPSLDYAVSYTPGETLWNLNVITIVDDQPVGWPGLLDGFVVIGAAPEVPGAFSSGFSDGFNVFKHSTADGIASSQPTPGVFPLRSVYTYQTLFDNGEIYQTRFTSKITASPFNQNSVMASWVPLEIAQPIAGWIFDESGNRMYIGDAINVWHEIRWIDAYGVMKDWVPLEIAKPIGFGGYNAGDWRFFQVGDYTGKLFQFRIVAEYKLSGDVGQVGVFIPEAHIEVDMPDRYDGEYNVACPAGGRRVSYAPAFKERPVLSITPDTVSISDQYSISNQDKTGFDIIFYDGSGASVDRSFDWLAKGYGAKSERIISGTTRVGVRKERKLTPTAQLKSRSSMAPTLLRGK